MKKVLKSLVFAASLCLTVCAHAQIEKGKWIASSDFQLWTNNGKSELEDQTNIRRELRTGISIGNMISNKLLLGVGLSYRTEYWKDEYNQNSYHIREFDSYGIDVYAKYFKKVYPKLYYAPHVNINLHKSETTFRRRDPGLQDSKSTADNK